MRAILVGPICDPYLKRQFQKLKVRTSDHLIGVDGGALWIHRWGWIPDQVVGDGDSLSELARSPQELKIFLPLMTLSREKSKSDLAVALDRIPVRNHRPRREVIALGFAEGARVDHEIANLVEVGAWSLKNGQLVRLLGRKANFVFVPPNQELTLRPQKIFSVFAWGGDASGVTLKGAQYPLKDALLKPSSRGLSNLARGKIQVQVKQGCLLVVIPN